VLQSNDAYQLALGMSKRKKTKEEKDKKPTELPPKEVAEQQPEHPFNFGGLPNRDLKKNLGCG
jgi:hypothetical protein